MDRIMKVLLAWFGILSILSSIVFHDWLYLFAGFFIMLVSNVIKE